MTADLPIEAVVPDVRKHLSERGLCVLTAEPGAGKTTVVPLRLLDETWVHGKIVVLEPRRVAARAVARRMASMLGEPVGETVGWRTARDRKVGRNTRIEVITEGILTRRLQSDPTLPGVAALIFDEFHERSVHADLGLAMSFDVRASLRPDLRMLVMSATIDEDAVAQLLTEDGVAAPVVSCEGRTFPVDVQWRPRPKRDKLELSVAKAVGEALDRPGDVLVFLPGIGEIRRAQAEIRRRYDVDALALHGSMPAEEQDEALRPVAGRRRVVLATDLAETSLTVEGIGSVIDSGLVRSPSFDPGAGISRLVTTNNSRDSADQRSGRAGRLSEGFAIRLWSKMEHAARPKHRRAELLSMDLARVVLEAQSWNPEGIGALRLMDQPSPGAIDEAAVVLEMLGALDESRAVTELGREMLQLPLAPRLAAMVIAAGDGPLGWSAVLLAALIEERDLIRGRPSERPVDLWERVAAFEEPDRYDVDRRSHRAVRERVDELARRAGVSPGRVASADIGRLLLRAYPDRLAKLRRGQGGRFRLRQGVGAEIDRHDPLAHAPLLVAASLDGDKRKARITLAAPVDDLDVELSLGEQIIERSFFGWDDAKNDLVLRVERRLGELDFGTHEQRIEPCPEATEALVTRIVDSGLKCLRWSDKARALQHRASILDTHGSADEHRPIDDDALIRDAEEIFAPWLLDATGRSDLEGLNVEQILRNVVGYMAMSRLDDRVPETVRLPTGRVVKIDFEQDPPRVSSRAQDFYGMNENPSYLDGALIIAVELLSPAQRPIHLTSDLSRFWSGSWAEVRKEMAGRYPKHDWPADPSGRPKA